MHSIHAWMSACQSYTQHTFFCLDFLHPYVAICVHLPICHIQTHNVSHMCLSLSPHLPLILRHYVGIACVQLCSSVYHTHVSTLTVRISLHATHVSLVAHSPSRLFVFCV